MGYRMRRLQDFARGVRLARELAERERWPRERLESFQRERLAELARHAAGRSAFWRERLPTGLIELSEVPVLTKTELMERFDELVTDPRLRRDELLEHLGQVREDALYLGEFRPMTSSGSSGRKAVFVYDRAGWRDVLSMFLRRSEWVGLRPSLPRTRLALVVENVDDDDRPVAPGEVGSRLLVTNLFNRVQPLIRLEVSDLVAVEPEPCPCGRSLMRVRSLQGRADVLRIGDVAVHPLQVGILTADPDVREFQVVQEGKALRLRVALRNGSYGAEERLGERLRNRLAELGVERPEVSVERVDSLERSPAGKLQFVVVER